MDDPIGQKYWLLDSMTDAQQDVAAALKPDWVPLRNVLQQAEADGARAKVSARTNWEKLHVLGLLSVDRDRADDVWVKRGEYWETWWAKHGDFWHAMQSLRTGIASPEDVI